MSALDEWRDFRDDYHYPDKPWDEDQIQMKADAAIAEQTAIIEAMEQFIDGCTYHMKNGETVIYEGPRL